MTRQKSNQSKGFQMAARGGRRAGAGRKAGAKNRATKEIKATLEDLAREHTGAALQTLADICAKGSSESARVAAATALLDRGYGKPKQAIVGGPEGSDPLKVELSLADAARAIAFMFAAAKEAK
jgi:hypothetical protein